MLTFFKQYGISTSRRKEWMILRPDGVNAVGHKGFGRCDVQVIGLPAIEMAGI
jgi:hypothetical protein